MGVRKQKSMIEKASETAADVVEQVRPQVESAAARATELAQEGMKQAAPKIEQGKVLAGAALVQALDAAADAAESAHQFAEEKAVAAGVIEDKTPKKKGGKLRKVVLFGGLVAAIGVVAKKLNDQKEANKWQPASTPSTPTPSGGSHSAGAAAGAATADDPAGADPAEALSDATDAPHAVTTPDDPADVVDVPPVEGYSTGDKPTKD